MIGRAFFSITALAISLVLLLSAPAYAQLSSPSAVSTYTMPYPGLLPDHPLYFVKTARDILFGMFISQPVKKGEYELHQADKRIEASYFLITKTQKKDQSLVLSTYSKGVNYFENAVIKAEEAKKQGMANDEFVKKLVDANQKHIERGKVILAALEGDAKRAFAEELQRVASVGKRANALMPQR